MSQPLQVPLGKPDVQIHCYALAPVKSSAKIDFND
jgi:hypothetical protein